MVHLALLGGNESGSQLAGLSGWPYHGSGVFDSVSGLAVFNDAGSGPVPPWVSCCRSSWKLSRCGCAVARPGPGPWGHGV